MVIWYKWLAAFLFSKTEGNFLCGYYKGVSNWRWAELALGLPDTENIQPHVLYLSFISLSMQFCSFFTNYTIHWCGIHCVFVDWPSNCWARVRIILFKKGLMAYTNYAHKIIKIWLSQALILSRKVHLTWKIVLMKPFLDGPR